MPEPHAARVNLLYTVITVLTVLAAVELGLHLMDWAASRVGKRPEKLPMRGLYQGQEWADPLARESDGRSQIYHQYLTWISKPQTGRFVNIDGATGRKTWNPPNIKNPEVSVYMFGGSACWGYGARDDQTIASQLSRLLNARALSKVLKGERSFPEAQLAKLQWSHLSQALAELAVDMLGPLAVLAKGGPDTPDGGHAAHGYPWQRFTSIGAGATEVQKNIIADRALRLPKR